MRQHRRWRRRLPSSDSEAYAREWYRNNQTTGHQRYAGNEYDPAGEQRGKRWDDYAEPRHPDDRYEENHYSTNHGRWDVEPDDGPDWGESSQRDFTNHGLYGQREYGDEGYHPLSWRSYDPRYDQNQSYLGNNKMRYPPFDTYSYGKNRGKGPKGYKRSDDRIYEDINDKLSDDGMVDASDVTVKVQNGEVTLSGTVTDRVEKRRVEDIVESISGTTHVENRIRVTQLFSNDAGENSKKIPHRPGNGSDEK